MDALSTFLQKIKKAIPGINVVVHQNHPQLSESSLQRISEQFISNLELDAQRKKHSGWYSIIQQIPCVEHALVMKWSSHRYTACTTEGIIDKV